MIRCSTADTSITVLVVNDIPATVVDGNVGITRLTADARTGSGASGMIFAGQGAGRYRCGRGHVRGYR